VQDFELKDSNPSKRKPTKRKHSELAEEYIDYKV
jgi:hypothetical protein